MLKANVCATMLDLATLDDVGLCGGMGADLCTTFGDVEMGPLALLQNKINLKPINFHISL